MILGIGVDSIEIARFDGKDSPHFMERVFTESERAYCAGKGWQTQAGLFAAKEAVAKALGTGFRGFWPNEIEIAHDSQGCPHARLTGKAARILAEHGAKRPGFGTERTERHTEKAEHDAGNGVRVWLSITHNRSAATAVAVIESA